MSDPDGPAETPDDAAATPDNAPTAPNDTAATLNDDSLSATQEFGLLVGVVVVSVTLWILVGWRGAVVGLLGLLLWTRLLQLERDDG